MTHGQRITEGFKTLSNNYHHNMWTNKVIAPIAIITLLIAARIAANITFRVWRKKEPQTNYEIEMERQADLARRRRIEDLI